MKLYNLDHVASRAKKIERMKQDIVDVTNDGFSVLLNGNMIAFDLKKKCGEVVVLAIEEQIKELEAELRNLGVEL